MNKTININLGGFFFHIDEIAFKKLKRYLDAIASSLSDDPQGKNEIIADIEARISELLSEKIKDQRQVVNENDIDEIIAIMGQPEDYADAEEGYTESSSTSHQRNTNTKKLFRDGDDKFLGGVCAGLGHYFSIDTIWIRLAFLILTLAGYGFGIVAYIILWILLPEAKTTSEKLQMEGEPVNIDNIEKKIRNEFETLSTKLKDGANNISDKISSADYDALKSQTKSGFQDFLDTVGKILAGIFKVFGKFMGVIFIIISGIALLSIFLGLFSVGSLEILNIDNNMVHYPPFFYGSMLPKWLLTTFLFLLIGIPFVSLFILGMRILSPNIKRLSSTTSLILSGLWFVSLLGIAFSGIEYATSTAHNGTKVEKKNINFNADKPLKIRFVNDNDIYYQHNLRYRNNAVEVDIDNEKMKYANSVSVDVEKSENGKAYIEIIKESEGKKRKDANENAEKIKYNFNSQNNQLTFDAYFLSAYRNLWKNEEVKLKLYVPQNTNLVFEKSAKRFLFNIENYTQNELVNNSFKMTENGLNCTNCEHKNRKTNNNDWKTNDDNDDDVTFLFDSTINNEKAELIINKNTTKKELEKLARWFKNKKNIDIDFSNSRFYDNGKLKKYVLKVDCNDGFSGDTKSKGITFNNREHGFVRNYNKNGSVAFKIW